MSIHFVVLVSEWSCHVSNWILETKSWQRAEHKIDWVDLGTKNREKSQDKIQCVKLGKGGKASKKG